MIFKTALSLHKHITRQFIFGQKLGVVSKKKQLAFAGDDDLGFSEGSEIYEAFDRIFGVGVGGSHGSDYHIILFTNSEDVNDRVIWEHFDILPRDVVIYKTSQFELQDSSKQEKSLKRVRPLRMGCSLSHQYSNDQGTLGGFVKGREDGKYYILSNYHVLYCKHDSYDDFVIQPGALDGGGSDDAIGRLVRYSCYLPSQINKYDAAIAGPISEEIKHVIPGSKCKIKGIESAKNQQVVYKIGAVSGKTYGRVVSFLTNIKVVIKGKSFDFANQILIEGNANTKGEKAFSRPGDSGALVIDNQTNRVVGLLFAGNMDGLTLANPIEGVLDELKVNF